MCKKHAPILSFIVDTLLLLCLHFKNKQKFYHESS